MKYFNIIISTLYLTFTIGVGISKHYCMGMLRNVEIGFDIERCCDESELFGDCCSDSNEFLVIDDDQISTDDIQLEAGLFLIEEVTYAWEQDISNSIFRDISRLAKPPPLNSKDRRIRNQSLVLYA